MSVAAWRIRKRVAFEAAPFQKGGYRDDELLVRDYLNRVLFIIDEELEAEAERQFTQRINPDPTTGMARELKENK